MPCIRYCMFGFGLQLPLPHTVTRRVYHSLSAIQLSPHNVLLVAFGGRRSFTSSAILSDTVLIELSMYCSTFSSYRHTFSMQSREEMVSGWWEGQEQPWKKRGSTSRCCQREEGGGWRVAVISFVR